MTSSHDDVRRKLDFIDKPYFRKTFYLDIKIPKLKEKVSRRILELGGTVEEFLSKEIHLLVTDRNQDDDRRKTNTLEKKSGLPLSRGQALMLKAATKTTSEVQNNLSNCAGDPLQNAKSLGVNTQKASLFLKDSNKILHKLRQSKPEKWTDNGEMDGVLPLQWKGNEKENINVLKLEDTEQLYKPSLKYFDRLPCIRYDENLLSPFDKTIILHRRSEKTTNRYSVQKKTQTSTKKKQGGFCEACDYWFKCSLREHLNSEKHKSFVNSSANFANLDEVIGKMPSLSDFLTRLKVEIPEKVDEKTYSEVPFLPDHADKTGNKSEVPVDYSDGSIQLISLNSQHDRKCMNDHSDLHKQGMTESVAVDSVLQSCKVGKVSSPSKPAESKIECNEMSDFKHVQEDSGEESSVDESESTEVYFFDSANESITRDCDSQDTKDSGTGPEIMEEALVNKKHRCDMITAKCDDSDSALPVDVSSVSHGMSTQAIADNVPTNLQAVNFEDTNSDNAVFLAESCQSDKSKTKLRSTEQTLSFQGVFKHIRNEDSIISENYEQEMLNNTTDAPAFSTLPGISRKIQTIPAFSPVTSPSSGKSDGNLTFTQLTTNWMKDLSVSYKLPYMPVTSMQDGSLVQHMQSSVQTVPYMPYFCTLSSVSALQKQNYMAGASDTMTTGNMVLPRSQETPLDLSKTSQERSVSRQLKYCPVQNKSSVLHQSNSTSVDDVVLLSMPEASENSMSCLSFATEISCSSNPQFYSESSMPSSCASEYTCTKRSKPNYSASSEASEMDTPKALDDSVFMSANDRTLTEDDKENRKPVKVKIGLKGKKKKSSKKRTRRQLISDGTDSETTDVYVACQQSDMKLKLCKVSTVTTPTPQDGDLRKFWKVRKSGGCRLVFSSEKRKAERMDSNSSDVNSNDLSHLTKRRRLLEFL